MGKSQYRVWGAYEVPSMCWLWASSLSFFLVREAVWHLHILVLSRLPKNKCTDLVGVIRVTFCLFYVYATLLVKDLQFSISLCPTAGKQCQGYACICSKELVSCKYCVFSSPCCCLLEPLHPMFLSLVLGLPWQMFPTGWAPLVGRGTNGCKRLAIFLMCFLLLIKKSMGSVVTHYREWCA